MAHVPTVAPWDQSTRWHCRDHFLSTARQSSQGGEVLFLVAMGFPRSHTQWYSQGCCPENRRQTASSLAWLMTKSCTASCARTQAKRAGSQEAGSFLSLPEAGEQTLGTQPILSDLVGWGSGKGKSGVYKEWRGHWRHAGP